MKQLFNINMTTNNFNEPLKTLYSLLIATELATDSKPSNKHSQATIKIIEDLIMMWEEYGGKVSTYESDKSFKAFVLLMLELMNIDSKEPQKQIIAAIKNSKEIFDT
jgi:hypothetical protein